MGYESKNKKQSIKPDLWKYTPLIFKQILLLFVVVVEFCQF